MNSYTFFQRMIFWSVTLICCISSQAFANISDEVMRCDEAMSFSTTEEFRDIIKVAKVISLLRESKKHSNLLNKPILYPIDILLASMTKVVEIDNEAHVVKANLTTGIIFNILKRLKEGAFLFDLQNRILEELSGLIKEKLNILEPLNENGYTLTLDRRYTDSFDDIVSQDVIFDQSFVDLLRQAKIESDGDSHVDPTDLFLSMIQTHEPYFIYELLSSHLTKQPTSFFQRWFGGYQRKINEIKSIIYNIVDTNYRYTSILQLRRRQNNKNRQSNSIKRLSPIDMNTYLLKKFGFFNKGVKKAIDQIDNNKLDNLRNRIKRRILRKTFSLTEAKDVENIDNEEIDILVNEDDVREFLRYHRNFTDEESELFIQRFIQRKDNTQLKINNIDTNENKRAIILIPQQQLIDKLNYMSPDDLENFISEVGFEISSKFMVHLMDPQRVPQYVKYFFIRFIAYVKQNGIFRVRTSNNIYRLKKIKVFNNQKNNSLYNYYSLHLGKKYVLVLMENNDLLILDRIISHGIYNRYF